MNLSLALSGHSGANQRRNVVEADGAEPRDVLCLSLSLSLSSPIRFRLDHTSHGTTDLRSSYWLFNHTDTARVKNSLLRSTGHRCDQKV